MPPQPEPRAWICETCGVQYPPTADPPARCEICADERQYVGRNGQRWTTLEQMTRSGYANRMREEEPGLVSLVTEPGFAIGQRAFLLQNPGGNVLWDCLTLLDQETEARVRDLGGLAAIAISHPHYYSTMVEWAERFGASLYVHAADRRWAVRRSTRTVFWNGDTLPLGPELTLLRLGGHFEGAAALHWAGGAGGRGVLLSGDTIQVVPAAGWVSFMYSYPNQIPLPGWEVRRIAAAATAHAFDRVYGAFGRNVPSGARAAILRSAERYANAVERPAP